jgi:putative endonuclease
MKAFNYKVGKQGENIAREYLVKKGYTLVQANFHNRYGEIDLIMVKDSSLIFVEVKLKIGEQFGSPEEMINSKKIWQVKKTAEAFLQQNQRLAQKYPEYQVDAVCIVLDENQEIERINHWENIEG